MFEKEAEEYVMREDVITENDRANRDYDEYDLDISDLSYNQIFGERNRLVLSADYLCKTETRKGKKSD